MKIWEQLPIESSVETYIISNFGEIIKLPRSSVAKRCPDTKKKVISPQLSQKGYHRVSLRVGKKKHRGFYVHRLVAMAFIENADNKPCINHKDGVKLNNHCSNLEWCTNEENNDHAVRIGLAKRGRKPYVNTYIKKGRPEYIKPIIDLNTGTFWSSIELAAMLNTKPKYVCRMLAEERKTNTTQYRYA